jgi:hypothetical protein
MQLWAALSNVGAPQPYNLLVKPRFHRESGNPLHGTALLFYENRDHSLMCIEVGTTG